MKQKNSYTKETKNIVLTGGHGATMAISVVDELTKNPGKFSWNIYWIGAKSAIEGKKIPTLESMHLPRMGVKHKTIISGRLQRRFTIWTIPSILKVPFGFMHALFLLIQIRPDVVLSFGGFAAFPVVVMAKLLGVPIVLHEQTIAVGRANQLSAFFADKITLARGESKKFFPRKKCVVVGNPLLPQIATLPPKNIPSSPAVIYVTGGSRGSEFINNLVGKILPELLRDFFVIHNTGRIGYEKNEILKNNLPPALKKRYELHDSLYPLEIYKIYQRADIVVGRAGAGTVSEIIAVKRPAVLIPIPFTYMDEQTKNAEFAKKYGLGFIIKQDEASAAKLKEKINYIYQNWWRIVNSSLSKKSPDLLASKKLVDVVRKVANAN
jgi:UDP-N-acetylglucosamine--N-acetylmuramyl-(pentapeptide) pyrophosphoryl-undecaprenol N-acetylglucosamine transferase